MCDKLVWDHYLFGEPKGPRRQCAEWRANADFLGGSYCARHRRQMVEALLNDIEDDSDLREFLLRKICKADGLDYVEVSSLRIEDRNAEFVGAFETRQKRAFEGYVYYVERCGYIKIGTTFNLAKRIRDISNGTAGCRMPDGVTIGPVKLLLSHRGGERVERKMHSRFAADRVAGEWFRPSADLLAHIERLNARESRQRVEAAA